MKTKIRRPQKQPIKYGARSLERFRMFTNQAMPLVVATKRAEELRERRELEKEINGYDYDLG